MSKKTNKYYTITCFNGSKLFYYKKFSNLELAMNTFNDLDITKIKDCYGNKPTESYLNMYEKSDSENTLNEYRQTRIADKHLRYNKVETHYYKNI